MTVHAGNKKAHFGRAGKSLIMIVSLALSDDCFSLFAARVYTYLIPVKQCSIQRPLARSLKEEKIGYVSNAFSCLYIGATTWPWDRCSCHALPWS